MNKYKILRKTLDGTRAKQIEMFLRYLEKCKPTPDIKNLIQLLIYLTLNDDFHREIIKVRKRLKIPDNGFESFEVYRKWRNKERARELNKEASEFVRANRLTYSRLEPLLAEIINQYIRLVKINYPDNKYEVEHLKMIDRFCRKASLSYSKLVGGYDVPDPIAGESNTRDFDKVWWEVYILPSDNLTRFKRILQNYYGRMMDYHFKDYISSGLLEIANKNVMDGWHKSMRKQIKITVLPNEEMRIITLKFQTYLNTKTKDVIRAFDRNRSVIANLQKKIKQRDVRGKMLRDKIRHYKCYLKGWSAPKIARVLYREKEGNTYSQKSDYIRTHIKEMKKSVSQSFRKKISL